MAKPLPEKLNPAWAAAVKHMLATPLHPKKAVKKDKPKSRQPKACAYQKLNPTILMMKSAEDRPSNELAKPLDRPTARRILVQRQVRSAFVVIAGVGRSDPAQMALAEDNRMIKALPADRADQSFRIPVLPR
jgi:hypothetical protein